MSGFLGIDHVPFNYRLRDARLARGWTRRRLAQEAGTSPSNVGLYEALRAWPTQPVAERIATALADDPEYLFPPEVGVALKGRKVTKITTVLDYETVSLEGSALRMLTPGPDEDDTLGLGDHLASAVSTLGKAEQAVILARFGEEPQTLQSIADERGVTTERIRQIQAKALRKLRHPTRSRPLRAYAGLGDEVEHTIEFGEPLQHPRTCECGAGIQWRQEDGKQPALYDWRGRHECDVRKVKIVAAAG